MSATATVMIVEGLMLAVVIVFVVALLRSHAEILRRLGAIEDGTGRANPSHSASEATQAPGSVPDGIVGETLAGDTVSLALGQGAPRTLLTFLSSGCAACAPLWEGLHDRRTAPDGARLVVVTKGAERESVTRLKALAPAGREVVMSSSAWEDFRIPATPHFVLVDGGAGILGQGTANSWEQIEGFLMDAEADSELYRARGTSERAARAEEVLATAGITAGHASLYPSRGGEGRDQS